ncbi:hypothetical protein [Rhizorhapis sp. SPR117]|uniref:hypothetical protein n=1 Tax=Rhizorhapis sp. SPR117 TaxID=2912611 RepID=UPI001F4515A4|nr:hypothetical protein [Rhizorhapis sp. SPR117]
MKNILRGAVAAIALAGFATSAAAQTNQRHYAGLPIVGTATNPSDYHPLGFLPSAQDLADFVVTHGIGTRYTAETNSHGDSVAAVDRIDVEFSLSGTVNRDCSFYAGNNASARNIDFGVIGIRTGDNENVNSAFEMVGPATANIETLTAGCNTNNVVEINKDDIRGLVNLAPGGYDTNEFQANIPYSVEARWTGVPLNSQANGTLQTLNVATNANAGQKQQGAWRSDLEINIVAPAVTSRGLVAGSYTGKTTVTLRAI